MTAFSITVFATALQAVLPPTAKGDLCVALSGGLDSTVLLAALAQLRAQGAAPAAALGKAPPGSLSLSLRAVHINHQLSPEAGRWDEVCARLCARFGIAYTSANVDVPLDAGEGLEAAARRARYDALRGLVRPGETLLTAHHADDQLETLLLALLRGSGARGLASMPACVAFGAGWHARPLLNFSREQLGEWARGEGLAGIEDPMNGDPRFARGYLRREVLPRLSARWPAAPFTAVRSAAHLAETSELLEDLAAADLEQAACYEGAAASTACEPGTSQSGKAGEQTLSVGDRENHARVSRGSSPAPRSNRSLSVTVLRELSSARRRNLLRYWLRTLQLPAPTMAELAALEHDMLRADADRIPCSAWKGAQVHRYRGRLFASPPLPAIAIAEAPVSWDWRGNALDLGPSLGSLAVVAASGDQGLALARLPSPLTLQHRTGGERLLLAGQTHHKQLKKLLQERGVLPWWRGHLPMLWSGERLVAVADLFITSEFAARSGEAAISIIWQRRPEIIAY